MASRLWTPGSPDQVAQEMLDRGFAAWSGPPYGSATAVPISQTEVAVKMPISSPVSITNLICAISAFTGGLTAGQSLLTLYQGDGTKLGSTADQSAAWGSAVGAYQLAVIGGPFVMLPPYFWVGVLCNGATPSTFRTVTPNPGFAAISGAAGGQLSGANLRSGRIGLAVTAPASFSPASLSSANAGLYWIGAS